MAFHAMPYDAVQRHGTTALAPRSALVRSWFLRRNAISELALRSGLRAIPRSGARTHLRSARARGHLRSIGNAHICARPRVRAHLREQRLDTFPEPLRGLARSLAHPIIVAGPSDTPGGAALSR